MGITPYGCSFGASITNSYPPTAQNVTPNQLGAAVNSGVSKIRSQIPWNSVELAVNTTSSTALAATGSFTITLASTTFLNNVTVGVTSLLIDGGGVNKETVLVTAKPSNTTFTATFTKTHTSTPYYIEMIPPTGATPTSSPTTVQAYNWTIFDAFVASCQANGILAHVSIEQAPTWHLSAVPGTPSATVPTPTDAGVFAQALLSRYAAGTFYAIDSSNEGYDASNTYVGNDLFQQIYTVCQQVKLAALTYSPQTLVGSPATIHRNTPYLENFWNGFYSNNCYLVCDYLQIHYYPKANTTTNPGTADPPNTPSVAGTDSLVGLFNNLQAIKVAHSDAAKPIWLTETGYTLWKNPPGTNGGIVDASYAAYLLQILDTCRIASGVQSVSIFDLGSLAPGSSPQTFTNGCYQTYKQYIGVYPTWSNPLPSTQVPFTGRDGLFPRFVGRDGSLPPFNGRG